MNTLMTMDQEKKMSSIDYTMAVSKYLEFLTFHINQSQFKAVFIGQNDNILYTVFSLDGEFVSDWSLKQDSVIIFNHPLYTNNDVYLLIDILSRDVIDMVLNLNLHLIKESLLAHVLPSNSSYIEINKKSVKTHQEVLDTLMV